MAEQWKLIEARAHEGFAFGLRYPSLVHVVTVPAMTPKTRKAVLSRILEPLATLDGISPGSFPEEPADDDTRLATVRWFLRLADCLNILAGLPIVDRSKCLFLTGETAGYVVPCLFDGLGAMHALLGRAHELANDPLARHDDALRVDLRRLMHSNLRTSNGPRLFRAAVERRIVAQQLPGQVVQYGLGRNAILMDSTFTQDTSLLGTRIARRKDVASDFLRRHGLPVAPHRIAADADTAIKFADELGYPVVVKPSDQDGGVAVQADLREPNEVRKAYELAHEISAEVMVEKHYAGRDYRLFVFRGELLWAVERQPAGVTGDGAARIEQLVAAENSEPGRGEGPHARLKRIKLDDEAIGLLARDGKTVDTIPAPGEFVRLRRSANISSGGKPIQVMDHIHVENAKLAVRAAEAVDLDLAGIDLIMPDISRPWNDNDTIICEVNAGPEIGGNTTLHLYPLLLESLLEGDGKIPVIAFYGGNEAPQTAGRIAAAVLGQGFTPGRHTPDGVVVGSDWLKRGKTSCLAGGRMLVAHKAVQALLLAGIDESVMMTGLPVPRIDVLVVTPDGSFDLTERSAAAKSRAGAILNFLEPCSDRIVLMNSPSEGTAGSIDVERLMGRYSVITEAALTAEITATLQATRFRPKRQYGRAAEAGSR